ncbi:MAG: hypothetical protein FWD46_03090 [Cystobacterineae bacterium]|nr:hypothetical protein [Cystobacterineae bacterium]
MKKKAPILCALLALVLAFSLFVSCKDKDKDKDDTEDLPTPVSCTVGDDSPCELWQRCHLGHCLGERQCETNDDCPGKTCKDGTCVPVSYCEMGCPPGEFVCVFLDTGASCQPGCVEDSHCSGSRICGGRDTTTGLGTCRNPTSNPEPVLCTVGDDSPCELWQRCHLGHCVGERQCETSDNCPKGKTCKEGTCAPLSECKVGCPPGEFVCISLDTGASCQPGCVEDSHCSGSRICGGHDTTTGLGTCRNPK